MINRTANPQQVHADDQSSGHLPCTPIIISASPARRTLEACERELIQYKVMEIRLRDALAESEERLRQKDELIQKQELLKKEFDHRLLNDLQMTISLLSLQSRGSTNPEAASQLAVAANRVAMIARIHGRLNSYEGVQTIEFKKFLADFGRDFSAMVSSHERPEQVVVEGIEINLPVATAIPLGFIASELITNAAKYGKSRITIRLERNPEYGYSLSVSNDGPALPEGFDPDASKGLGMKIIQSFAGQIGGELRVGRGDDGQGARFTVLFSATTGASD
jgi:two-component system, sensor histidine kinase PdtaS